MSLPQSLGECRFSPRLAQLARLVAEGLPYKEIAWRMGLSEATTRQYIQKRIFERVGVRGRAEFQAWWAAHVRPVEVERWPWTWLKSWAARIWRPTRKTP